MRIDSAAQRPDLNAYSADLTAASPFAASAAPAAVPSTTGFDLRRVVDGIDWSALGKAVAGGSPPLAGESPFAGPGTAFVKGAADGHEVDFDDIDQGNFADCYLLGTLGALAKADPNFVKNMIKANSDGTYTVTLYDRDTNDGALNRRDQVVDPKSFSTDGALVGDVEGGNSELWPKLIEKAYAQMKGGYDKIRNGGNAESAMESLTGREAKFYGAKDLSFEQLSTGLSFSSPISLDVVADPKGGVDDKKAKALGDMGMVWWHTYSVVGAEVRDGVPSVKLYNPWGDDAVDQPGSPKESDGGWVPYQKLVDSGIVAGLNVGASHFFDKFKIGSFFGRISG